MYTQPLQMADKSVLGMCLRFLYMQQDVQALSPNMCARLRKRGRKVHHLEIVRLFALLDAYDDIA